LPLIRSIPHAATGVPVRPLRSLFALATLALCAACGRVGLELTPVEKSRDAGSDVPDGGSSDASAEPCIRDRDDDGTLDCDDACPDDPEKIDPGVCGCDASEVDTDGDGELDCVDTCGGSRDADYVPDATCGVGYCRTSNTPSSCVAGTEVACVEGSPLSAADSSCDGVDDDCSGAADEDYAATGPCGTGYCRTTSVPSSCAGGVETACQPGAPRASNDGTADGVDDDCDGQIDEDACIARTETYGPGAHTLAQVGCRSVTVKLWGGGGASGSGDAGNWGLLITGGTGGPGGYSEATLTVNSSTVLRLDVGGGGQGCGNTPGTNPTPAYNGGAGANGGSARAGSAGADGSQAGGTGPTPSGVQAGGKGGNGSFGGGGGGTGNDSGYADYGPGGSGGAASVLSAGSTLLVAGGGGGGGGAGSDFTTAGHSGGAGGSGCSGNGTNATNGGAGGGGGVCLAGSNMQRGSGRTPYDPDALLTGGAAAGGNSNTDCATGGPGHAIVTFSP
jgi:predicted small lipoprotein YifL